MKKICIYYNPCLDSTRLVIDGMEHTCSGRRIDEFIVGQPLKSWLSPYVYSYRRWDGILAELMEELNDDELELTLFTVPEFFGEVRNEFLKQATIVEEKGYDSQQWTLTEVECYSLGKIAENALNFIQKEKHFLPDQHSMILMEYGERDLLEESKLSVKKIQTVYNTLNAAIEAAGEYADTKDNVRHRNHWEKAKRELTYVFGGKK